MNSVHPDQTGCRPVRIWYGTRFENGLGPRGRPGSNPGGGVEHRCRTPRHRICRTVRAVTGVSGEPARLEIECPSGLAGSTPARGARGSDAVTQFGRVPDSRSGGRLFKSVPIHLPWCAERTKAASLNLAGGVLREFKSPPRYSGRHGSRCLTQHRPCSLPRSFTDGSPIFACRRSEVG